MAEKKKAVAEEKQPEPKVEQQPPSNLEGKTIDERMADLLKDHQKMGARP